MKMLAMTVLCVDKYPEIPLEVVGGNSLNIAAQWIHKGQENIAVLGTVGSDYLGDMVLEYLKKSKIEHSHVYQIDGQTAHNHFYKSKDSELFYEDGWVNGVFGKYRLTDNDWDYAKTFDLIAIGYNEPNFNETIKRFAGKKEIIVDFLDNRDLQKIKAAMKNANLGFLSGNKEIAESLIEFSKTIESPFIITAGANGSYCVYKGILYYEKAVEVLNKVDTIGCGDSFQAAFVLSWYKDNDVKRAMKEGALASSKILQCYGGVIDAI